MAENEEFQLKTAKELTGNLSDKQITQLLKTCDIFGPYQRWLFVYIFIMKLLLSMSSMSLSFSTTNVPFLCYPPNFNVSAIPPNTTENEYLRMLQPDDDQCSVYNNSFPETYYTQLPSNVSKLQCSYGRKFLTEEFSTIVSEFDLVCERKWLRATLRSVYFAGYLIGSIIFGGLGDRYVPESPRWLIGRKQFAKAQALLRKFMKKNKKPRANILYILTNNDECTQENNFQENISEKTISLKEKTYTFFYLFKTSRRAVITLNICFSWLVVSMLYYGVILNSVDMAGNRYINFLLMAIVEYPCYLVSYYLFNCFGHRKPISFFMMFSGLNCIVSNFVTKGSFWFPLILVVLGKFGVSAAFGSIYLLSAEIFPTVVRTNGIGLASMSARIGSMSAPFILQLSPYVKWLPLSIYGVLAIISGILLLLLPQTKDKDLPQTFEDLENCKK